MSLRDSSVSIELAIYAWIVDRLTASAAKPASITGLARQLFWLGSVRLDTPTDMARRLEPAELYVFFIIFIYFISLKIHIFFILASFYFILILL